METLGVTEPLTEQPVNAAELAELIRAADFSQAAATVIGAGTMGRQYVQALRALGVRRIRVCARTPLATFAGLPGVEAVSGGIEHFSARAEPNEVGIVATPIALLRPAAERLMQLGFKRLLIEKPVALSSGGIEELAERCGIQEVDAVCAYNRIAYPSLMELQARAAREGGITSCTYTFTELIKPDWPQRFAADELARWGIANSLHPISLAHSLIGWPARWTSYRSGALPWHAAGAVFVGAGVSGRGILFSYHADWGSTGRWSVEAHTAQASYRLCPLEQLARRTGPAAPWEEVPVPAAASDVKAGITEQVAAAFSSEVRRWVRLPSLRETAALTRYAEDVFGYSPIKEPRP